MSHKCSWEEYIHISIPFHYIIDTWVFVSNKNNLKQKSLLVTYVGVDENFCCTVSNFRGQLEQQCGALQYFFRQWFPTANFPACVILSWMALIGQSPERGILGLPWIGYFSIMCRLPCSTGLHINWVLIPAATVKAMSVQKFRVFSS